MGRPVTQDEFITRSKEIFGEGYFDYRKAFYKRMDIKITLFCNKHKIEFDISPNAHLSRERGCRECGKQIDTKTFIEKSKEIFGNSLDYSKAKYTGAHGKVILICKKHNEFSISATQHINEKRGCLICFGCQETTASFIKRSESIFGDAINHSKVNYVNSKIPILLICNLCNREFEIPPAVHLCYKRGCLFCNAGKIDTEKFIIQAKEIYGDKYDYSKSIYGGCKKKLIITCGIKNHGDFERDPSHFLTRNQGCPKCSYNAKRDLNFVIEKSNEIHNNKYDFSKAIYNGMFVNLIIICPTHGEFDQAPSNHIHSKSGCPKCAVGTSKKEKEWLDMINIPDESHTRLVKVATNYKNYNVDGYDPQTKTIYEFYGDYWHGNPAIFNPDDIHAHSGKKFSELYDKVLEKERYLKEAGYKIVYIWETDFDKLKSAIKPNNCEPLTELKENLH